LLSIDVVSAGVVLLFCLLGLPATGLDLTAALKRLWFLPAGALLAAWGTAILAEKTGTVVIDVGPVLITTGSLSAAAAIFARALALAIPLIVLASTIDPRDLSDALIQHLRLPEVVSSPCSPPVGCWACWSASGRCWRWPGGPEG